MNRSTKNYTQYMFLGALAIVPLASCESGKTEQQGSEASTAQQQSSGNVEENRVLGPNADLGEDILQEFEMQKPRPPSLATILNTECGLEEPLNTAKIILDQTMLNPYTRNLKGGEILDVRINLFTTIVMENTQKSIFYH